MPNLRRQRERCAELLMLLSAVVAAPSQAAVVRDGLWDVSRTSDGADCLASLPIEDGTVFGLAAADGQVTFIVAGKKRWPKASSGTFSTDKVRFEFKPAIDKDLLSFDENLNDRALAALRDAEELLVGLDGRPVFAAQVKGTGLAAALDGVIACSKGEAGWWGKGAIVSAGAAGAAPAPTASVASADAGPVYNKDGPWGLLVGGPGICVAQAKVDRGTLQIVSAQGTIGLAVGGDTDLPQGRRGLVETDSFKFDFKPDYGGRRHVAMADPLDSPSLFALRRAKSIRLSVDGKLLADAELTGTGFPEALEAVAACSNGKSGWWGKGAPAPK